jgi:hypothetical protein
MLGMMGHDITNPACVQYPGWSTTRRFEAEGFASFCRMQIRARLFPEGLACAEFARPVSAYLELAHWKV